MASRLFADKMQIAEMAPHWRRVILTMAGLGAVYAGFGALEQLAITYLDYWIALSSIEQAEWLAIAISQAAEFLRYLLVGVAIRLVARTMSTQPDTRSGAAKFLVFWLVVSGALSLVLLGLDSAGYDLQFTDFAMEGETFRAALLALIYAKIAVYYVALRLLFGAGRFAQAGRRGMGQAWAATSTIESLLLFVVFLAAKLSIDGIIIPMVSYLPFIAPFWFIPDEQAPHRYILGQGTRIVSEGLALWLYALAWICAVGRSAFAPNASVVVTASAAPAVVGD